MVGEAYPDEGFCVGLSRQSWCDFGVRKQLFPGINLELDDPGGDRGVIPTGSGS